MPSKASAPFDLLRIFDALVGVNYIVVGGVAATLHGAPRLTFDLDIVPDPSLPLQRRLAFRRRIHHRCSIGTFAYHRNAVRSDACSGKGTMHPAPTSSSGNRLDRANDRHGEGVGNTNGVGVGVNAKIRWK